MRYLGKFFWMTAVVVLFVTTAFSIVPTRSINLPAGGANAVFDDEEEPDVKARVARISFIRGEVKIKRIDNDEWEKAVLNLPLVEGDEIATSSDSRVELQFNNYVHVRLDAETHLKMSALNDGGVAVSLTQGTLGVRITNFERAGGYFEIDAPKTTIALEKSGAYRIDAGKAGDAEMRVSVSEGGGARVYSDDAGFTLKSGRTARVFIDGSRVGEWETAEASSRDEFDTWAIDRDSAIAKRLKLAFYNKYYDEDIYAADDLNDHGEWIHTSDYGYVWRPYDSAVASYADWSPYRYGHWRWVSPFGWTWVNDEPWGWATYHHGRWIWHHGRWVWCPYSYYRPRKSWWFPALVVINIVNTNVCWYPLGYRRRWHNYNRHHNGGGTWSGNSGPRVKDPVGPGGGGTVRFPNGPQGGKRGKDPADEIPTTGVITVTKREFGTGKMRGSRAEPIIAKKLLDDRSAGERPVIELPGRKQALDRIGRGEIRVSPPTIGRLDEVKTGATTRQSSKPLDEELRVKRMLGGRKTTVLMPPTSSDNSSQPNEKRSTGAVERPVMPNRDVPIIREPVNTKPITPTREPRLEPKRGDDKPRYEPQPTSEPKKEQPRTERPTRVEQPRIERTPRNEQPRNDPKPPPPPTRQPTPKSDPPPRSEPRKVEGGSKQKPIDGR